MHVTAHVNISFQRKNQKRNNLNCGRIIAGLTKLHQFLLVALRSDNSPHYTVTTSAAIPKSEAWPPKSRDITWTSSFGGSWRDWCAVKIQGIDIRQPEGASEALLGPYLPAPGG